MEIDDSIGNHRICAVGYDSNLVTHSTFERLAIESVCDSSESMATEDHMCKDVTEKTVMSP